MAVKTNVSSQVLNRIRSGASVDYRNAVPIATPDADCIRSIGKIIMDSPNLQNEFCNFLINRIAKVIIERSLFVNPLSIFDKGLVEYGDVIEEVFVDLCEGHTYNVERGDADVFKRVKNNIKSAFHVVNSYCYYKSSINPRMLRKAFLNADSVETMVADITGAMVTSYNYDNYLINKYQIAKAALGGTTAIKGVTAITTQETANAFLETAKEDSNNFEFLSREYNTMSVANSCKKEDQYLILTNKVDSVLGVQALAYMFGTAFAGNDAKKIRVDNFTFTSDEMDRIEWCLAEKDDDGNILDGGDTTFTRFTSDELTALSNIQAMLLDGAYFQNYGQLLETTYIMNPANLFENYWLHVWKVYSTSPFANALIYAAGTNGVASVEIDDADVPTVTAGTGGNKTIDATVTVTGLVPKGAQLVKWSVTTSEGATGTAKIDNSGKLTWSDDFTAADTITIKCESAIDSTKYDTATITVAAAQ